LDLTLVTASTEATPAEILQHSLTCPAIRAFLQTGQRAGFGSAMVVERRPLSQQTLRMVLQVTQAPFILFHKQSRLGRAESESRSWSKEKKFTNNKKNKAAIS